MNQGTGVAIGIVESLDDPESIGRIKLRFPWMSAAEPTSSWARIAVPMAGADRGMQFMPEVEDEVLVAFEQGELRKPYVIGALWSSTDAPPVTDAAQRVIRTVSGHEVLLDDTEGSERIAISFKGGGPSITLDQDKIEIRFNDSSLITLSASDITVKNDTLVQVNP
jgi:uncharacterized protein involved in type VI secretion and phage assembly